MLPDGRLLWTSPLKPRGFLVLDGIRFVVDEEFESRLAILRHQSIVASKTAFHRADWAISELLPLALVSSWKPWRPPTIALLTQGEDQTARACQGDVLRLRCPEKRVVVVLSAWYGRSSHGFCPKEGADLNIACRLNVLSHAQRTCSGLLKCNIVVDDNLGVPCPLTHKYLTINFACHGPLPRFFCFSPLPLYLSFLSP